MALAYFVRRRSQVALGAAIALRGFDLVALFASASSGAAGGLLLAGAILFCLFPGFGAIRAIKAAERDETGVATRETQLA